MKEPTTVITANLDSEAIENDERFKKLEPDKQDQIRKLIHKKATLHATLIDEEVILTTMFFFYIEWPKEGEEISDESVIIVGLAFYDIFRLVQNNIISKKEARRMLQLAAEYGDRIYQEDPSKIELNNLKAGHLIH